MQTTTRDTVHLPQTLEPRNPGMALDLDWVMRATANRSAIERRAATLPGRRSVKKDYQAAWLCRAVTCIDLTTLAGDDTVGRVNRLCAKARQPVRAQQRTPRPRSRPCSACPACSPQQCCRWGAARSCGCTAAERPPGHTTAAMPS